MIRCHRRSSLQKMITLSLFIVIVLAASSVGLAQKKVLQVYLAEKTPVYVDMQENYVIPLFEEMYPDVEVELQIGTWNVDAIAVRYIGGSAPDVIQLGSKVGGYTEMLLPLNKFTDNWDDLADFAPALIDGVQVDGKIYAIPFAISARTLTYRKDFFSEAGLDPETPPVTWEDLVTYGQRLVKRDADGIMTRQAIKTGSHQMDFAQFLMQAGGSYMSEDLQRVTFADEPGLEALEFMHQLFHEYRIADVEENAGDLRAGGAAMEYVSPSAFSNPDWSPAIRNEDVGVALPLERHRRTQIIMPNSWGIINTSPLAEEAWNWIKLSSELEVILNIAAEAGYVPPRLSAGSYSPWSDDPRWGTTFQAIAMASTNPLKSPHFEDLRVEFVEPSLKAIFFGGDDVQIGDPRAYWIERQNLAQSWLNDRLSK